MSPSHAHGAAVSSRCPAAMRGSNDGTRLYGTMNIAGHESVNLSVFHLAATSRACACFVQLAALPSLQNLCCVRHGLAMAQPRYSFVS